MYLDAQRSGQTITVWKPILLVVLPLGLADVAVVPLMDVIRPQDAAAVFVYSCFGLIVAQGALLSIALVFGDGAFWKRLLIHWGIAGVLIGCWYVGFLLGRFDFRRPMDEEQLALCLLPALSLAVQAPLWIARVAGWRFQPRAHCTHGAVLPAPDDKLSLRDLFVATAMFAVAFAIARLAISSWRRGPNPNEMWVVAGITSAVGAGVSLIGPLPLMWFFSWRQPLFARWAAALGYAMIVGTLVLAAFAAFAGLRRSPEALFGFVITIGAFTAGICAGLSALEWSGVHWQRDNRTEILLPSCDQPATAKLESGDADQPV